jgi:hypothetical protein
MPRSKKAVGTTPDSPKAKKKPHPKAPTNTTPKKMGWQDRFIELLAVTFSVTSAAQGAGIDRSTAYRYKYEHPEFAARWDDALNSAIDRLEKAAYERAVNTSDTLAIFLLKTRRPDLYRDQQHVNTTQFTINYSDLTQPQLERLANGEDPATVISTKRDS